jgi:monoamine oxidase
MNGSPNRKADVCVIGAGVAGLIAADAMLAAGLSVDVFEAQGAVGGRVKDTVWSDSVPVELGANWFSSKQPLIKEQIERFGLETVPTHNDGDHLIWWNGKRSAFRGALPSLGFLNRGDVIQGMVRFDATMKRVANKDPWNEELAEFDHLSFGQWIDRTLHTRMGREFFRMVSEMVFGVESHLVSFLYVLHYSSRSVSLASLISVAQGHQELRFKKGPGELCRSLSASVGADRILLNAPVREITVAGGYVRVASDAVHGRYRAALCAVPPPAVRQILFSPPRTPARDRLLQALPMGRVIKIQAIFERPYWLEHGLSGQVMSNSYPLSYTIDNSPHDRRRGVLAAFVCTSSAERFMDAKTDRKMEVSAAINRMFGRDFPAPVEILIEDWAANEWIGGSYGAYFPPGVMSRMGRVMRSQEPPIYWCGAEYGQAHPCQIEGALESGLSSARSIGLALTPRAECDVGL